MGTFKKGATFGALLGAGLMWLTTTKKGKEVRTSMLDKVEELYPEIRDQIIIQGKKYASVDGRKIFVVSLKITNEFDQGIEINSRNYLRLSTNGNEEWLAPEYHNDPVTVQAISTKPTRVAFTVDQSAKDLVLQVGEIKGEKQKIEISITP